jgi:hypothetical protein
MPRGRVWSSGVVDTVAVVEEETSLTAGEGVSASVRAQLLATEHWSLLASRSTTQNELLVRIAIFLTLVSASIIAPALVGQATDFDGRFDAFAIVLASILLLVGTLTVLHVANGSDEDMAYVIGMNRLRAAYAELDGGIDRYFIASKHDDDRGISQTYTYFPHSSSVVQPLASSLMFILVVDAVLAGVLAGLIASAADGSGVAIGLASAAASATYLAVWAWHLTRRFNVFRSEYEALFRTPPSDSATTALTCSRRRLRDRAAQARVE